MKTDDQLIEDFWITQGGKPHDTADIWFYGSSWDMLMPVVNQIIKLGLTDMDMNERLRHDDAFIARMSLKNILTRSDITGLFEINPVYLKCSDFIKWYNELATTNREEI